MLYIPAELLIDFVPRDAYLIYGVLNKEWHKLWKKRKFAILSHVIHFLPSKRLICYFVKYTSKRENVYRFACWSGKLKLIDLFYSMDPDLLHCVAIKYNYFYVLKWIQEKQDGRNKFRRASRKILYLSRYFFNPKMCHLCKDFPHPVHEFYEWEKEICISAASRGHVEVLEWARANGCPQN